MSGNISSTGNEIVDSLIGLQLSVNSIRGPEAKFAHLRDAVGSTAAHSLLDGLYQVTAAMAFGRSPDMAPDSLLLYQRDMTFLGQLVELGYLTDPDVPVDAFTLNFREPILLDAKPQEVTDFSRQKLYIPVLAITSWANGR